MAATPISGATGSSYTTGTLSASNNGDQYYCIVTDASGSLQSATATLFVSYAANGAATIAPIGAATGLTLNSAVGAATLAVKGAATAVAISAAIGYSVIPVQGVATGQSVNRADGAAQISVIGASRSFAVNRSTGAATITPAGAGIFGPAQMTAAGYGRIAITGYATALSVNPANGSGLVDPVGHGTAINGNPYATVPQFYLRMPARSFTVSMPARSFYLQDTESMPAQTFPSVMDPAEVQPLTIDKTPDLASGETLTALSGTLQVTVTRGNDSAPSTRFGTPVINAAQIPATPPAIPTTIAPNMGLQIEATDPQDGCWYLLRQACTTSTGRVVMLKGILQSTAS